jgi:hypothetical protein
METNGFEPVNQAIQPAPPQLPTDDQQPLTNPPPKRFNHWTWPLLLILLLVAAAAAYQFLLKDKTSKTNAPASAIKQNPAVSQPAPYMVFYDDANKVVSMTDKAGKIIYKSSVPKADFYNFVSVSPTKQVLLSVYNQASNSTSYYLLDSKGLSQSIEPTIQATLKKVNSGTYNIKFIAKDVVAYVSCASTARTTNSCSLSTLNLIDGTTKQLLKVTEPSYATGESLFDLMSTSSDSSLLYFVLAGPSSLGNKTTAVFSVDLSSAATVELYELPADRSGDNLTVSSDGKKVVYDTVVDSKNVKIYTVDLNSKKEYSQAWPYGLVSNGYTFSWSPDNSKVLAAGSSFDQGASISIALIDPVASKLTDLVVIPDAAHNLVQHIYWLDNQTAVYDQEITTTSNDFRGASPNIKTLNVDTKQTARLDGPGGYLIDVFEQ